MLRLAVLMFLGSLPVLSPGTSWPGESTIRSLLVLERNWNLGNDTAHSASKLQVYGIGGNAPLPPLATTGWEAAVAGSDQRASFGENKTRLKWPLVKVTGEIGSGTQRVDVPSAFEITPPYCGRGGESTERSQPIPLDWSNPLTLGLGVDLAPLPFSILDGLSVGWRVTTAYGYSSDLKPLRYWTSRGEKAFTYGAMDYSLSELRGAYAFPLLRDYSYLSQPKEIRLVIGAKRAFYTIEIEQGCHDYGTEKPYRKVRVKDSSVLPILGLECIAEADLGKRGAALWGIRVELSDGTFRFAESQEPARIRGMMLVLNMMIGY